MNSGCRMNSATCENFPAAPISFVFSAILSFWSLICNVDIDSNSLCLDRRNNFGINSLQKLQNFSIKCDQ